MGLSADQIATAVWGTGYGSRRHLIDRSRSKVLGNGTPYIVARCSVGLLLDFVDSIPDHCPRIARRQPCGRCYGIAATEGIPIDPPPERNP